MPGSPRMGGARGAEKVRSERAHVLFILEVWPP